LSYSIIIFCFNEQDTLEGVFQSALKFLQLLKVDFEIIIVNDGSTDNTLSICNKIQSQYSRVKIIHHKENLGIGLALSSGYNAANKEYVCAIPGDGQFDIDELKNVKHFDQNLYYSFYRPQTNYSFYRKCLTWLNRLFNQHILAVYLRDVNWIKVYRKEHLNLVKPELKSSLIESEICAKLYKQGILPIEIPSNYLPRTAGVSKGGSWKTLRKAIAETLKLWWVVFTYKKNK
jgi:glycosyltransferase involved in cell wall biosynthesis